MKYTFRVLTLLALAVLMGPAQQQSSKQLYVVTYIDVFPNYAAGANKLLLEFAAESRKDPGSLRFEVLRDIERPNHFTIVEVWQSRDAYQTHLALDHTKQFRMKLQPGLGSPFDERLYYAMQ